MKKTGQLREDIQLDISYNDDKTIITSTIISTDTDSTVNILENHPNLAQQLLVDIQTSEESYKAIPNSEFLHAKVYSSEAEREFKKANRQYNIVNDALINTLSIDKSSLVMPITNLFYIKEIEPLEYFENLAIENNPLLKK